MKYQFDLNVNASLTPEDLEKICPNANPTDPATEKVVNAYFQNQINDLIAGKFVSSKKHAESLRKLENNYEEKLRRANYMYIDATSRPYDK